VGFSLTYLEGSVIISFLGNFLGGFLGDDSSEDEELEIF